MPSISEPQTEYYLFANAAKKEIKANGKIYKLTESIKLPGFETPLYIGFTLHECRDGWYGIKNLKGEVMYLRVGPETVQIQLENKRIVLQEDALVASE